MPTEPIQQIIAAFEISLLLAGGWLLGRLLFRREPRRRWLDTHRLPAWPVAPAEFTLFLLLVFFSGLLLQTGARLAVGKIIHAATDRAGLEVLVYGAGFHGGALLGGLFFPLVRRKLYFEYGSVPPPLPPATPLPWGKILRYAGGTLAVALPALGLVSVGWTFLLRHLGVPDEPQDLIAIFSNTRSPGVIIGMLLVACVLAPLNEELIFRAGIYRFCRQTIGRHWALLISGALFGALHGNWAGFLPLAILGAGLALVYEATGDIRVTIVAHGLFNLNTVLIVLSGLSRSP